jgi:hypothetical protein
MARTKAITTTRNDDGTITFKVADQSFTFNPDRASPANRVRAELHGWVQRISDKAALGKGSTDTDKFTAMKACAEFYEQGRNDWNMRGAGAGRKSEADWIIEATAEIQGVEVATMRERIERMAEKREVTVAAYVKALGTRQDVALRVAEMKCGNPTIEVDLDELGDDE